jgi:hypothetical protein
MPSRIEELAQANLKPVPVNPCVAWDEMVAAKMASDDCARSVAADRCLATASGSDAWAKCQSWDAAQPKILPEGTKSGFWGNAGNGAVRRVPRRL